jgi:hypothetical protein
MPAAVLFLINAWRKPEQRIRSGLLGSGFAVISLAGPLHDVATTAQLYAAADIFSILGIILIGSGVVYRLEQTMSLGRPAAAAPPATPEQP